MSEKENEITNTFQLEVELNFREYSSHVKQTNEGLDRIMKLLEFGLNSSKISSYYVIKNNEVVF